MLILSRKPGEKIVVPQFGVSVTVLSVHGRSIRIGIAAPPDVPILRGEIVRRRRPKVVCPLASTQAIGESK